MNETEYGNKVLDYYAVHISLEGLLKAASEANGSAKSRAGGKEIQLMCDDAVALKVPGVGHFLDPAFRRMYDDAEIYESMKDALEGQRGTMLLSTLCLLRRLDGLSHQELDTPSGEMFTKAWQSWETPEVNLAARVQEALGVLHGFGPDKMEEAEWRYARCYLLTEVTGR